ncbi:iron donor protein CyaY [Ectothiorhodospira lacustris]|uniref:iron donor protein CyaY n=1 Tax=Ectothiorhodospira lacustris TaxID=2899127 RepID=UPI001EE845A8|nr:iron donor protein CyaY [Ectothiorhodospira lacustris]MCG5501479.1 iron donor protein CyaY [Ectothiorhodospira lacustris]MCG5510714.1 iron donor protein CyaY [Ectothiorhodospira lacustris]MCG5522386.1 iron donor protein CyaY [Ectothiorhodospira lacustris]
MNPVSFAVQAEQALESLVERMSEVDALADLDMDLVDGVLKMEFDDGSKLIINRQEPVRQLWLASPEGPAHFNQGTGGAGWVNDRTGEGLLETLNRVLSQKLGEAIRIPD